MSTLEQQFRAELKELLKKYNVSINWNYSDCSDTHGMYGEGIEFSTHWGQSDETSFRFVTMGQGMNHNDL